LTALEGIVVEIREPGRKPRRVPVNAPIEVGRGCKGVLIADDAASRRHLTLTPGPEGLFVTDLGSSNGTYVNGAQLTGRPRLIKPGDVVRVGETELSIAARSHEPSPDPETVSAMVVDAPAPRPRAAARPRPAPAPQVSPAPPPPPPPPPVPAPPPAARQQPRPARGLSLEGRAARRLEAAHGWVDVEIGGVEWSRFVEAVVDTGLDDLPAVIARLRARADGDEDSPGD
jgi:predicted component of type VI protein secretion system